MSEMDEIRAEMAELRAEVNRLREESAATRTLAAMADRDVAELRTVLRGQTGVLNALRETQVVHGQALHGVDQAVRGLAENMAGLVLSQAQQTNAIDALTDNQVEILRILREDRG